MPGIRICSRCRTGGTQPFQAVGLNTPGVSRVTGITGYADNWKAPAIQSFNLSIQHQLSRTVTFDVGWVGNKVSKILFAHQLNDVNVQTNGMLDAFLAVRAGQNNVPLMDQIFNGVNVPGVGVVNGTSLTAAQALRRSTTTQNFFANGTVGAFANFVNTDATFTGKPGGLLLNGGLPQNFIVASPQWSSVTLRDNSSNSTYHALQTHVSKRISQGVTGQFSYTFSKNLGDGGTVRDQRNFALSKGLLAVDRTHIITSNATYNLPFGQNQLLFKNAPGWLDRVINGWQVSSTGSWTSGAPLSFTGTGGLYNSAAGNNTLDLVGTMPKGDVVKGNGFVSYFNTLHTAIAPLPNFGGDTNLPGKFTNQVLLDASGNTIMQNSGPGRLGTMAFYQSGVRGPGFLSVNMSATKTVKITEGKTFTLRADAVNVLNKPQWGAPNTNINGATFGRITTATGSRTVTLNARIDF